MQKANDLDRSRVEPEGVDRLVFCPDRIVGVNVGAGDVNADVDEVADCEEVKKNVIVGIDHSEASCCAEKKSQTRQSFRWMLFNDVIKFLKKIDFIILLLLLIFVIFVSTFF